MPRVHSRTDFEYIIVRGCGHFARSAYACVITQSTAHPDIRLIHHIEYFYSPEDGIKTRAAARRYGREFVSGKRSARGYREQHLFSGFSNAGLPMTEKQFARAHT